MAIENYLTQTITVLRRTQGTVNEYGESNETWPTVTTIVGVIQPKSGNVGRQENGEQISSTHRMYCLSGSNIRQGDRVQLGSDVYQVLSVVDAAARAHHYQCDLRQVN